MADILVGTTKGLFILEGGQRLTGPFCDGWPINHAVGQGDTVLAAGGGKWFGCGVWRRDRGEWAVSQGPFEGAEQMWSVCFDGDRVLAGSKPAYLYESRDGGATWARLDALTDQPGADQWMPGAAGLTLLAGAHAAAPAALRLSATPPRAALAGDALLSPAR